MSVPKEGDEEHPLDRIDRERQEQLAQAIAKLETHAEYAYAQVQIYERTKALDQAQPLAPLPRDSDARLERVLLSLDIRCECYLQLVSDLEYHKAFARLLDYLTHEAWLHFSGFPIEHVPPPPPAFSPSNEHQIKAQRFRERGQYWHVEGFRRLDSLRAGSSVQRNSAPPKRGYRSEVRAWMKHRGITSVRIAAKSLGVSEDVLKSIMSEKTDLRCSVSTLESVLATVISPTGEW